MGGYVFVHFTGEQMDGEQVYFSLSRDGLHWNDLNEGKPILRSGIGERGVRDPFLVRDEERNRFYLMATDLKIGAENQWEKAQYHGSRNLILWESGDLVHWSEPWSCRVGVEQAGCVWAPEAVYDREKKAFFVFFSSMVQREGETEAKQRVYGTYTSDFVHFTPAVPYIEKEHHVIDATIVESNGMFYRFIKDESEKKIIAEYSDALHGIYRQISSKVLEEWKGVEGPECYPLPDGTWCLIADQFQKGSGYLPLVTDDLSSGDYRILDPSEYDFEKNRKRHGGILPICEEEYRQLEHAFG